MLREGLINWLEIGSCKQRNPCVDRAAAVRFLLSTLKYVE